MTTQTTFVSISVLLIIGWVRTNAEIIVSTAWNNWGAWGEFELCPPGLVAQGFQLKTQPWQGDGIYDDTALNAIRLFCGDPKDLNGVTSFIGQFGEWGKVFNCFPGVLTGFQLRVEPYQGYGIVVGDDTGTNNVRFWCDKKDGSPATSLEGDGMAWGKWIDTKYCPAGMAICGIQTQVEWWEHHTVDCTSLNNVRFECCFHS